MNVDTASSIDIPAAAAFLAGHGRLVDRRRFALVTGASDAHDGVLAAMDAYRNADGGYGWGLEPDLRSPESQPTAGMHAFEVMAEAGPAAASRAVALCDWMATVTLPDGGLPQTLPVTEPAGCAPFWLGSEPTVSTLQMTGQVAANALRVARDVPAVADHPWLGRATGWCVQAIETTNAAPYPHELLFAVRFVDALGVVDRDRATPLLGRLSPHLPPDGVVPVEGGAPDEALRLLDFVTRPDGIVRSLFTDNVIATELDRLTHGQQPDGGWTVDFESSSPAAALEWRGYATVAAVTTLTAPW